MRSMSVSVQLNVSHFHVMNTRELIHLSCESGDWSGDKLAQLTRADSGW